MFLIIYIAMTIIKAVGIWGLNFGGVNEVDALYFCLCGLEFSELLKLGSCMFLLELLIFNCRCFARQAYLSS